jgi:sugar phosphate isomerase/epimerase
MKVGTFYPIIESGWEKENSILFDINFDHFELLPENEHLYTVRKLAKILRNKEVILHTPFVEANLISNSEGIRKASVSYYQKILNPLIQTFSPNVITLHVGYSAFYYEGIIVDQLRALMHKIPKIAIENMPNNRNIWKIAYPDSEKEMDTILALLNNPPMTFDVGHWMKQGYNVYKMVQKYMKSIANIHIHDVVDGKDHKPLGTGDLDVEKFIRILRKNKYDKYLTIEMASNDPEGSITSYKLLKKYV